MRLVRIYTAGGQIEAESLRAALLEANIPCQLDGAPNIGMPGLSSGWNMASIGVLISDSDQARAREIVQQWQMSLPERASPPKVKFQYGRKWIFVVITLTAVLCMLAKLFGASGVVPLLGTIAIAVEIAIFVFGYVRKRQRKMLDD
jgi:hypothetical protein